MCLLGLIRSLSPQHFGVMARNPNAYKADWAVPVSSGSEPAFWLLVSGVAYLDPMEKLEQCYS